MKKTLVSTIVSALTIGVASTTFAAANPFSDVPVDHWSFDAVMKLAQEGVIEGYSDGTFNGNAHITRYEMAQMVAKAMAKTDRLNESDQTLIDRLAAEYADELNNLGVRVAKLEKNSDNVAITGWLRLNGVHLNADRHDDDDSATGYLRMDIAAKVNENWTVKGRFDANTNFEEGGTSDGVKVMQAYAQGPLFGGVDTKLGEFGQGDAENLSATKMLIDTEIAGVEFTFGNALKTQLTYGRLSKEDYSYSRKIAVLGDGAAASSHNAYAKVAFEYDVNDALALAAGWYHIKNKDGEIFPNGARGNDDTNDIWSVGLDYKFDQDWNLGGAYAASSVDASTTGDRFANADNEKSYVALLSYKNAEINVPGSYGIWVGYRQLGQFATINPTIWRGLYGAKGYEIGLDYMFGKNLLGKLVYFDGEYLHKNKEDVSRLFGRLEFTF